jgi:acyl-CoA thioesterase-1
VRGDDPAIDRRVLFFGDSLVAGAGDPTAQGWVGRVAGASFGLGLPLTAYNLGVRGETSEQVAARWRAEALPRLAAGSDARVVLSFGANDTTVDDGCLRVEPERSCAALADILGGVARAARADGRPGTRGRPRAERAHPRPCRSLSPMSAVGRAWPS